MLFRLFLSLLLCSHLASSAFPLRLGADELCFRSCQTCLQSVQFVDTGNRVGKPAVKKCFSRFAAESLFLCLQLNCEDGSWRPFLNDYNSTCRKIAKVDLPPFEIVEKYTSDEIAGLRRLGRYDDEDSADGPVLPSNHFFDLAYRTISVGYYESEVHIRYGWAMYWFWVIIFSIGVCHRFTTFFTNQHLSQRQPTKSDAERNELIPQRRSMHSNRISNWFKAYITVPATFGYRCSQHVPWGSIPPRIQSLAIVGFVMMNIVFCSTDYEVFVDNLYWPKISNQLWRHVSDRTGVLSIANFPLIWLLGTRNNLLLILTGWDFGTCNSMHRWLARISTLQAVIHSIGYTYIILERSSWSNYVRYWHKHYFWNGQIATVAMCALCILSMYALRRSHYEFFLVSHIAMSIMVLQTMFYHVEIFKNGGAYDVFIWPCVVISVADRASRVIRVLSFNPSFWRKNATISYDRDSDIVTITAPIMSKLSRTPPGTFYYIYAWNDFKFWESHPFTAIHTNQSHTTAPVASASSSVFQNTPIPDQIRMSSQYFRPSISTEVCDNETPSEDSTLLPGSTSTSRAVVFLIRPYSSFTARLRDTALRNQSKHPNNKETSISLFIEGPYGSSHNLNSYENILFIVGGTGIVVALSYLLSILASNNRETDRELSIHIVWAVRETAFLHQILRNEEFAAALTDERVKVFAHITKDWQSQVANSLGSENEAGDGDQSGSQIGLPRNLELSPNRPDVSLAVREAAERAGNHESLAVVGCGPARMADDARAAVVEVLATGKGSVDYFQESFLW